MDSNAMEIYINLLAKSHVYGNPVRLDYEELSNQTGFSIAVCRYLLKRLIKAGWIKPLSYRDKKKLWVYNIYEIISKEKYTNER